MHGFGNENFLFSYDSDKYYGGGIKKDSEKDKWYTLVVTDMIDTPRGKFENLGLFDGDDEVEGYTIRQLEDALKGRKDWNGWRDEIKRKYYNATEEHLDDLFENHIY
ncbi:MAG: hypothetical protein ABJQ69_03650 [Ekhidna sp.]